MTQGACAVIQPVIPSKGQNTSMRTTDSVGLESGVALP